MQNRIRQWQAQGAANAPAPDAVSVRSPPISVCASTVSRPKSDSGDESSIRIGRRTRAKAEGIQDNARSGSAPRKRIISDGHWKAQKEVKDQRGSKPASRQRPESARYDLSYTSNQETRKDRRRSKTRPNPEVDREARNTSLYDNGARKTAVHTGDSPPAHDLESHVDDELARHFTTESILSGDLDRRSDASIQPDEGDISMRGQSKYVESLGRAAGTSVNGDIPKSKKAGLFGKTRDIFMKSEAIPAVSNRVPSIEAWLDEQPDPFVDEHVPDDKPPVEVPRPLRKQSHRKRPSTEHSTIADPNKIWDSISPQNEAHSHKSAGPSEAIHSPNSDQDSTPKLRHSRRDDRDENDGSPSGLRRRGARIRRQRESPRKGSMADAEISEVAKDSTEKVVADSTMINSPSPPQRVRPPPGVHQLSTIASVETFKDNTTEPPSHQAIAPGTCDLKRKLTTHEDLMSVLSLPRASRNRRSARSARSARAMKQTSSAQEVLAALVVDEERYLQELRTLVDGVIPVLLQSVLSKTDSVAAAGLFTSSTTTQGHVSFTKPIIDMGISLERLKTLHNRIPLQNVDSLLNWAQTAQRAYRDYLHAWRLGFQDVVVNLAPLEGSTSPEQGMARDEQGDLIDTEGKKVDVAYLLKRPLIRVKALNKTFSQIRDQCDKPLAAQMADTYADLTTLAKRRHQEEQARLEDEAAAGIDASRARDIRTMAAMTNVVVDKSRRVKARDYFNLTIYHSSGQRIDCGIELIFRDSARGAPVGGDVLVCEVDDTGKWLLFAPVELSSVSARRGEGGYDIVVMIRGRAGLGQEWHELLALKTDDKEAVTEWITMLGSNPLPPRLNRTPSFAKRPSPLTLAAADTSEPLEQEGGTQASDQTTGLGEVDVPIGEPSAIGARSDRSRRPDRAKPLFDKLLPRLNLGGGLASKPIAHSQAPSTAGARRPAASVMSSDQSTISDRSIKDTLTILSSSSSSKSTSFGHDNRPVSKEQVVARWPPQPLVPESSCESESLPTRSIGNKDRPRISKTNSNSRDLGSSPTLQQSQIPKATVVDVVPQSQKTSPCRGTSSKTTPEAAPQRPEYHRALSSTPSKELPTVNKVRSLQAQQGLPCPEPVRPAPDSPFSGPGADGRSVHSKRKSKSSSRSQIYTEDVPAPPGHTPRSTRPSISSIESPTSPPAVPAHNNPTTLQPTSNSKPSPELKATTSPSEKPVRRRTSSPLKHEYAPSTSSDSSSNYDTESLSDSSSDTSEDLNAEDGDIPTPLVAITAGERRTSRPSVPPASMQTTGTRTLAPSDSASQGPYRKVPASTTVPAHKKSKTIALICSWSDRGMWEQVHPDECSIVISPGLIEAFEMSAAHSDPQYGIRPSNDGDSRASSLSHQPLVAFELTPIVPLRRGTALDISIRSPPTANSQIRTTSNIMFRSRNAEECEALYGMINWARCNNPTYIQLQNARPHRQPSITFNVGQDRHSRSKSSSWFSFGSHKKSSYRASSAPTPASTDMSVESSGTITSAFSALKRLGASSAFNLKRSSVIRKNGSSITGESVYSSSSGIGTGSGSGSSTPAPSQLGLIPGKDGPNVPSTSAAAAEGGGMINNMKIRLYLRKGQHWENLGAARLTVLPVSSGGPDSHSRQVTPSRSGIPVEPSPPVTPRHDRSPSNLVPIGQPGQARGPRLASSNHTPHRIHGNGHEKRVLITRNKDRDAVLLDSVLGESCFERVMQTGIALKVWNADEVIAGTGGVTLGKERVYMMQFPGTREAGWVFGLCGTYRYGAGANDGGL